MRFSDALSQEDASFVEETVARFRKIILLLDNDREGQLLQATRIWQTPNLTPPTIERTTTWSKEDQMAPKVCFTT